jgi:hypothetical protein
MGLNVAENYEHNNFSYKKTISSRYVLKSEDEPENL